VMYGEERGGEEWIEKDGSEEEKDGYLYDCFGGWGGGEVERLSGGRWRGMQSLVTLAGSERGLPRVWF
jgi:hypothetical protein